MRYYDQQNKYSEGFLKPFVKSDLIYRIIMLNRWNGQKKCLVVDDEFYIRLSIGA
jgi:hypothetical protein